MQRGRNGHQILRDGHGGFVRFGSCTNINEEQRNELCAFVFVLPLLQAANFLNIKPLLDLTCAKIATKIKGKSVEEIRKTFNIVNDFTPEQEAQVIRDGFGYCCCSSTITCVVSCVSVLRFVRKTNGAKRLENLY